MLKKIAGFDVEISKKKMKNIYIKISSNGKIQVSASKNVSDSFIREFVTAKSNWIEEKLHKFSVNGENIVKKIESGEDIYFFGEKYILNVIKKDKNFVLINGENIDLYVKDEYNSDEREKVLNEWYREKLKEKVNILMPKCENHADLYCNEWQIKNMKTRWGTCNTSTKKIWINLQLAKMPEECLIYVLLHELTHLKISNHGPEFKALLDKFIPQWRQVKKYLNEMYPIMK